MSPPEAAPPSVSLPEPAPRGRLAGILEALGEIVTWGADDKGCWRSGEPGREGGWRVLLTCALG